MNTSGLAITLNPSFADVWWVLLIGTVTALGWVSWLQIVAGRWPLKPHLASLALLLTASAIWPGSPLFETWYQGRNVVGAAELSTGAIFMATGVGISLATVRSRSRSARAVGFASGGLFVGFTAFWFTQMAFRIYNTDGVEMNPVTVVLISFAAHPLGWVLWYPFARAWGYHTNRFPPAMANTITLSDNRYCWQVLGGFLGAVALAGGLGFLLNINHYETFSSPYRSGLPGMLAYRFQMQFETILLIVLPAVMCGFALLGTREKLWIAGRCRNCDYDLRGDRPDEGMVHACPECGKPVV